MRTFRSDYAKLAIDLPTYGPLVPVTLTAPAELVTFLRDNGFPPFERRSGYALIDTGARRSAVDAETMAELSIPSVGVEPFLTTHGVAELPLFNLSATIPDLQTELLSLVGAPGGLVRDVPILGQHIIMLLGRDILERCVLTYDGPNATITLQR